MSPPPRVDSILHYNSVILGMFWILEHIGFHCLRLKMFWESLGKYSKKSEIPQVRGILDT